MGKLGCWISAGTKMPFYARRVVELGSDPVEGMWIFVDLDSLCFISMA